MLLELREIFKISSGIPSLLKSWIVQTGSMTQTHDVDAANFFLIMYYNFWVLLTIQDWNPNSNSALCRQQVSLIADFGLLDWPNVLDNQKKPSKKISKHADKTNNVQILRTGACCRRLEREKRNAGPFLQKYYGNSDRDFRIQISPLYLLPVRHGLYLSLKIFTRKCPQSLPRIHPGRSHKIVCSDQGDYSGGWFI